MEGQDPSTNRKQCRFKTRGGWVGPGGMGRVLFMGYGEVILAVDQSEINGPDQARPKRRRLR